MADHRNPRTPELLAPAGDLPSLKAALLAGADAVYLAGKRFGARAFAANFDENGLWLARRATLSLGRKLYVTLNTLVFDSELPLLEKALDFYESLSPDAVIIQDLGVAAVMARRGSRIPRHLSTQAAWFGVGGLEELQNLGVSRVILPREMTLQEIGKLGAELAPLELEVFVHGAMCYSISGRCFWSIALGSRSGNRGTCAQPCRKPYRTLPNGDESWIFSPKDLRLIGRLGDLRLPRLAALKIEGRMKGPDYVYHVVRAYRQALDMEKGEEDLERGFSRSFHAGFLDGPPTEDWTTGEDTGRESIPIGRVVAGSGKNSRGLTELRCQIQPAPGDGISWLVDGKRNGERLTFVEPVPGKLGHFLVRGLPDGLPSGAILCRTSSNENLGWLTDWKKEWERTPVDLFWSGREGQPLAVETMLHGRAVRLTTDEVLVLALGTGLEAGPLPGKFTSLGELFLARRQVFAALGTGLFVPLPALKKLKRALVEALIQMERLPQPPAVPPAKDGVVGRGRHDGASSADPAPPINVSVQPTISLRVWNKVFPFVRDARVDFWILPFSGGPPPGWIPKERVHFWLPPVLNQDHLAALAQALSKLPPQEFLCLGWEAFAFRRICPQHQFRVDWCFNLVNRPAIDLVTAAGLAVTAGREWPGDEPLPPNSVTWTAAWNPLVSFSRFPPKIRPREALENSHKDRFFMLDLGNGVSGIFLCEKIAGMANHTSHPLQIDIAVGPQENPIRIAARLDEIIENPRAGRTRVRKA